MQQNHCMYSHEQVPGGIVNWSTAGAVWTPTSHLYLFPLSLFWNENDNTLKITKYKDNNNNNNKTKLYS